MHWIILTLKDGSKTMVNLYWVKEMQTIVDGTLIVYNEHNPFTVKETLEEIQNLMRG